MSDTEKIKIAICDDHAIVRHAIRTMIESTTEFCVVAETDDCESTLKLLQTQAVDILTLDIGLRGRSGIEVIHQIRESGLATKIIVFSMHEEESYVKQALMAGAQAYLAKDSSLKEIVQALHMVLKEDTFVPKRYEHLKYCAEKAEKSASKDCALEHPLDKLSKREREVFYMLVEGMPNRIIAKQLFLSPRTVETHRSRLIKKLGLNSTADLVRYAIKNNLHSV